MRADLVSQETADRPRGAAGKHPPRPAAAMEPGTLNRGGIIGGLIDVLAVFLEQAPIHYNGQSGPLSLLGRFPMNDALLHPDGSDPHL